MKKIRPRFLSFFLRENKLFNEKGTSALEYALITLAILTLLSIIVQIVNSNLFGDYLEKAVKVFLISVDNFSQIAPAIERINYF